MICLLYSIMSPTLVPAALLTDFVHENLKDYSLWVFITYALVAFSMVVDLVAGLYKSRKAGRRCNSRGLKRTCDKAMKYFLPMICLTCIDLIGVLFCDAPYLTMAMAAYCSVCEFVSVLESTHRKNEIARLVDFGTSLSSDDSNRELLARLSRELLNSLQNTNDDDAASNRPN